MSRGLARSCDKLKSYNSTTRLAISNKLGRMIVYLNELIEPYDLLVK